MPPRPIVPCLWFDDQAEEAARFYTATFPDGRITAVSRYPESVDNPGRKPRGSVLTVEVEVAGQRFTALNGGPRFVINPSVSFFVHVATPDEATRLFSALAEDGKVLMPIDAYPWSPRYGWLKDRFGLSWQVVPSGIAEWMASPDVAARDRAFQAMMGMGKPDVAALRAAFEGRERREGPRRPKGGSVLESP
jgi:predicted 3-demethylubiquinone-9 3-methyltransferase (glyoxalase superfamily)